jgi:hypothetical protein
MSLWTAVRLTAAVPLPMLVLMCYEHTLYLPTTLPIG